MSISRVDSISALRSTTPSAGDLAELTGYYTPGDEGGGEFYWDSSSTVSDNNGTIIKATPATGRWIRVFSEPVDVRWFGAKGDNSTDDTSAINAAIGVVNIGEIIFGQDGIYLISGTLTLSKPVVIDLNSATIQFAASVSTTSIGAFTISSDNVTIKNGIINGTFVPATDTPSPGVGPIGINNNSGKSNLTVDRLTIQNVQSYGIVATNGANPIITNSRFINTGYIGLFCVNNSTAGMAGGVVEGNLFDRSGIPFNHIKQPCVAIRGNSTTIYTSGLVFSNNRIIGQQAPTDTAAECIEIRYLRSSTLDNNVFINGTIGLSIVGCSNVTASANSCFNCIYGLEIAFGSFNTLDSNVIDGNSLAGSTGILLDGAVGSTATFNTISNNNISGVTLCCIEVYSASNNNNIIGGVLTQANHGQGCINILGAQSTLISGVIMNGLTVGSWGVQLDNSGITTNANFIVNGTLINNCMFLNFNSAAINVYAPNGGTISGLRFNNNELNSGSMLSSTLASGATIATPYYYGNSPEIIGSKVILATGTNASAGSSTLAAGNVTVANTLVTANSLIFLSVAATGGTQGILSYTKVAGTSFAIHSTSATDTSTIAWLIVN